MREGRISDKLAGGFLFLLAKPEFFLHLASWRVIICTPKKIFL
jgi:hypothetical protein